MGTANFILTIDLELMYGYVLHTDHATKEFLDTLMKQRDKIIGTLIKSFEQNHIHATWAFVGNLLTNIPVRPAPPYDLVYSELFEAWPIEEYESLYLAQDILARIKLMETEQEIALHSFFHIPYDDHAFSPAHVLSECKNADTLREKYGLPFVSMVFPRNRERYRSLLKHNGFTHYRGRSPLSNSILLAVMDMFGSPRHGWAFASNFFGIAKPKATSNLTNIPATMCLKKRIPIEDVVTIARKLIAKAVAQGGHFHLYFHIHDLIGKGKGRRLEGLESILDFVGNQVESGNLRSVCMGDISV